MLEHAPHACVRMCMLSASGFLYYIYNEAAAAALAPNMHPCMDMYNWYMHMLHAVHPHVHGMRMACMCTQVAFLALAEVAPVTHAVTNTVKRVVIILASILVFKTTITPLGALGSAITILGALLYALAKQKYK